MTTALGDRELLDELRASEERLCREHMHQTELIAEATNRGLVASYGCRSMADLLSIELKIGRRDASARVSVANAVGTRRHVTGEALPPRLEPTAAAYEAGVITNEHVRAIARVVDSLPDEVAPGADELLENALVDVATKYDPDTAAKLFRQVRAHFDAQGMYDEADRRERDRGLSPTRLPDGSGHLRGTLTPRCAEALETVLDAMARPSADAAGEDGRDHRSRAQRTHDALQTLCETALAAGLVPGTGGCRTTVVLRMDVDAFATGEGTATTGHGYVVPADLAKQWLEPEAKAILVLLSKTKGITAYSSVSRLFSEQQRLAMLARDGGCTFPGCDAALPWTEAHHVTDFAITRRTSVDDGALLCEVEHRTHERAGWDSVMLDGRPSWIPPEWLDPQRRPRRNTRHDLEPP